LVIPIVKFSCQTSIADAAFTASWGHDNQFSFSSKFQPPFFIGYTELIKLLVCQTYSGGTFSVRVSISNAITNRVNFIMGDAYGKARACAFSAYSYSGRSLPFKCKAKAIAPRG
jgi:hypothetical protein